MNLLQIPRGWNTDYILLLVSHADGQLSSAFVEVVGYVIGISTGLALIAVSICLVRIMIADEPAQVSEAKGDIKTVVLAWIILNSLWVFVNFVIGLINAGIY